MREGPLSDDRPPAAAGGDGPDPRAGPIAHLPVLLRESVELLAPERGGLFVDATVGLGGHAEALLARGPAAQLVGLDRDPQALRRAAERLAAFGGPAAPAAGDS